MEKFNPTHEVVENAKRVPVQLEDGHEGGRIAYTQAEWETSSQADWEVTPEGALTFQGRHSSAKLVELSK